MSLDACVYCDCFEKGKLREPLPAGVQVKVEPDGLLSVDQSGTGLSWSAWYDGSVCDHDGGRLLHYRLGNIALIGLLRSELQRQPAHFPILLTNVVYNGIHGGDFLPVEIIPALQQELELLADFKCSTPENAKFMSTFRTQMLELAAASLSVNKPIAF